MANRYDDEFGRDREQRGRWDRENDRHESESGYGREGNYGRDSRGRERGEGSRGAYGQGSYGQGTSYGQGYSGSYAGGGRSQWDRGDYAQGESSREYGRMYGEGGNRYSNDRLFERRQHNEFPLGGGEGFHATEGFRSSDDYRPRRQEDYRSSYENQRGYEPNRSEGSGYQSSRGWGEGQRGTHTQTGNYGSEGQRGNQGYGGGMGSSWGGYGGGMSSYGGGMSSGFGANQGRHTGRGPKGYQRSDDRIKEDINERLTQHSEIDASEIDVQVQSGEVTLSGTVDERNAKRMAEDVAENVSGVKEVHNQIRVKQQDSSSTSQSNQSSSGTSGVTQAGTPVPGTKTR